MAPRKKTPEPETKTRAPKPGNENTSQIFRLSPKALAKVEKIPKGKKSAVVSKLIELTAVATIKELAAG